jgi:hypothetical protein
MKVPSAVVIRIARDRAGLTQAQAADLVHLGAQPRWAEHERGVQPIDLARWELFLLLTNQHPEFELTRRG